MSPFNPKDYEVPEAPSLDTFKPEIDTATEPFEDTEFPAETISVYKANQKPPPGAARIKKWLRPHQVTGAVKPELFVDDVNVLDVQQGGLGDCWFIGSLCILADSRHRIEKLIVSQPSTTERGKYTFRFYRDGQWKNVTIDDRLPCDLKGNLVFAKCTNPNEFWVPLLEKAYAKFMGSYASLEGGFTRNALVDMTGGFSEVMDMKKKTVLDVWNYVSKRTQQATLIGASSSSTTGETGIGSTGLMAGHAYAVIDCFDVADVKLIRLKNPWANGEWKGAWADNSVEWKNNTKVADTVKPSFADDGTFHMTIEDFCKYFTTLDVCRLINYPVDPNQPAPVDWKCLTRLGNWNGEGLFTANTKVSRRGPQLVLTLQETTDIIISLTLHSSKYLSEVKDKDFPIGFHVMKSDENKDRCFFVKPASIMFKSTFEYSRENSMKFNQLAAGTYLICPSVYFKDKVGSFVLRTFVRTANAKGFNVELLPNEEEYYHYVAKESQWDFLSAGGCMNSWKWIKNPQFLLTMKSSENKKQRVRVGVEQVADQPEFTGMYILQADDKNPTKPIYENKEAAKPLQFINRVDNVSDDAVELDTNKNYVLVPTTFKTGVEMKFTIKAFIQKVAGSPVTVELTPLTDTIFKRKFLECEWTKETAGGCPNNKETFWKNPKIMISAAKDCEVDILLCQEEKDGKLAGVGFHVFKGEMRSACQCAKTNSWGFNRVASLTVQLQANIAYYVLPSTYNAGDERKFTIVALHSGDVKLGLL